MIEMGDIPTVTNQSARFTLNSTDFKKMALNFVIFALPDFIVFLGALAAKFTADGAIVVVLILNLLIDGLKKFLAGHAQ